MESPSVRAWERSRSLALTASLVLADSSVTGRAGSVVSAAGGRPWIRWDGVVPTSAVSSALDKEEAYRCPGIRI